MSVLSTLENCVTNNRFKFLIDSEDLEVFKNENLDWCTQGVNSRITIEKNITTAKKLYSTLVDGVPKLEGVTEQEEILLSRMERYFVSFSKTSLNKPVFEEIGNSLSLIGFENSYDNSKIVRDTVKKLLSRFYSYDEEFITSCFNLFDGCNVNAFESLFINHETKTSGFSCSEYNTIETDVDTADGFRCTDLSKRILMLYGMYSKTTDHFIDSLKDVLYDENFKVVYFLPQKSSYVPNYFSIRFFTKHLGESRKKSIQTFVNILVTQKMLDEGQAKDLNEWEDNPNHQFGYFDILFEKTSNGINIQPSFSIGLTSSYERVEEQLSKINYDSTS
jgi:hypothetical protein